MTKSRHILLVEDDDEFRQMITDVLELFDHEVTHASSAEAGLTFLEKKVFDMIISDITMPGISGLEMAKIIRQRKIKTPIIIISGHSDSQTIAESLKSGINDYIQKPLNIKDLPIILERNFRKS